MARLGIKRNNGIGCEEDLRFLARVRQVTTETFPALALRYCRKDAPLWKKVALDRRRQALGLDWPEKAWRLAQDLTQHWQQRSGYVR